MNPSNHKLLFEVFDENRLVSVMFIFASVGASSKRASPLIILKSVCVCWLEVVLAFQK